MLYIANAAISACYQQKQTFYEILNVPKSANLQQIKRQFKKLSLINHPDKKNSQKMTEGQLKQITAKYQEIIQAYETLKDPQLRAEYD